MKKQNSYILIIAFSIILLGIIGVQVYWLKTALDLREKQFEGSVYSALQNVIKKVEEKENADVIGSWMGKDTTIVDEQECDEGKMVSVISRSCFNKEDTFVSKQIEQKNNSVVVRLNASSEKGKKSKVILREETMVFDTVPGNFSSQHIQSKIGNISVLVCKMLKNKGKNGPVVIEGKEVEKILKEELAQQNISISPDLVMKDKDKFIFSNTSDSLQTAQSSLSVNLYPNDLFGRKMLLYINFPGKLNHLAGDMKWTIAIAVLFTLLMVVVFVYTLVNLNRQKKLNDLKTDFINNMSHELKTPVASIQLASDMLYKNAGILKEEQVRDISKTIHEQSVKINEDVKNILQHSLLELKKENKGTHCSEFHILPVIKNAVAAVYMQAEAKHIEIKIEENEDIVVYGNEELLAKAIINLLDNAIKYSGTGKLVSVNYLIVRNRLLIEVKDQGIGIPADALPLIFDKFYRVEKGDIHNTKGYGLGLSFVKKAAEIHNGKVWAESELGTGSRFYMEIPLMKN